ncbi:MAG: M28 family peptidase [Phycisphaeraceae bacterium]|nr:M28 family peptidase [Phycisphaeraceae bacterium]
MPNRPRLLKPAVLLTLAVTLPALSVYGGTDTERRVQSVQGSPIADVLSQMPADVRAFDIHISTLAGPYMQGRVPGSIGSERAKDYVQYHLVEAGLTPAFPDADGNAFRSYRQPFPLSSSWSVEREMLVASKGNQRVEMQAEREFMLTAMGQNGTSKGEAVFLGYGIDDGPDGYNNFEGVETLEGKIAVVFRFEPMDGQGRSLWNEGRRGWSGRAGFQGKLRAVGERNPAGIVIINPPGASDTRGNQLGRFQGPVYSNVPVMVLTAEAADRTLKAFGSSQTTASLREHADSNSAPIELGFTFELDGQAERKPVVAENVGGVLRGVGDLADQWIVVGAHLDHLGMGYFGSRSGPGSLHPGADDNASGTAGLLLLADLLSTRLAGDDRPRRSILIVGFDAEESGLNGSAYYTRNPIVPIEDHMLMVNWDMIGRIVNERVLVAGGFTGEGLSEFIAPYFAESGLEVVVPETMSGASDHTPFYRAGVPVLFSIIADFHSDYHTPEDVVWKINRVGAVKTVRMYENIVFDAAMRTERFRFISPEEQRQQRQQRERQAQANQPRINVRVGVVVDTEATGDGVVLAEITENSPASQAGLRAGDRLVRWDGQKLTTPDAWRAVLANHKAGDVVNVGVSREGQEVTVTLTLQGR